MPDNGGHRGELVRRQRENALSQLSQKTAFSHGGTLCVLKKRYSFSARIFNYFLNYNHYSTRA